jgi:hypothetical protein
MRVYNKWAGNPKGRAEDPTRCIAIIWDRFVIGAQCGFKRGKGPDGLYCGIHARHLALKHSVYTPSAKD